MELLETIVVMSGDHERRIGLYHGDLTRIPPGEAVDVLVVSTFPGDYSPTPTSLVGALYRAGISVGELASDKAEDLREDYGCWLSKTIDDDHGFHQILCFEPALRGSPPEVVGDIFRCLMPVIEGGADISSIAMPLVASGDARWPRDAMFTPLIEAAIRWLELGLRLDVVKVVERSPDKAAALHQTMTQLKVEYEGRNLLTGTGRGRDALAYDVFLSYSRDDQAAADFLAGELHADESRPRVFQDTLSLDPGVSWQQHIWEALEVCRKVVALYSPTYLISKVCQEEYGIARIRERNEGGVLVPLYLTTAKLPAYIRLLDYIDCREADRDRLQAATVKILA
jgi:hypothetical protein